VGRDVWGVVWYGGCVVVVVVCLSYRLFFVLS
jgi:hypothetical protein